MTDVKVSAIMEFDAVDQRRLLDMARNALNARVYRLARPEPDTAAPLDLPRGAFVSIHHGEDLRGCLGRITPDLAVGLVVSQLAQAVADSDPRFPAVRLEEVHQLDIEVSILTPERPMRDRTEIAIGRHGLIVEHGHRRGLLLPQVASDYGWDPVTFLEHTCIKAGLATDAWRRGAQVFLFEAQVFGEAGTRAGERAS